MGSMCKRVSRSCFTNRTRRDFLKGVGVSAAIGGTALAPGRTLARALGANGRMGLGFIGCGYRAGTHLARLKIMKAKGHNIDCVAFNDVYRPRLDWMAKTYSDAGKKYSDYHELLADPNVDLAVICTPDHHHGYQAIDAIKAGKDVYCEKPVTHWRQFELTKKLFKVVTASDQVFMLGTQRLVDPAYKKARKLIEEGLIGRPIHAECGYFRMGDGGERGMPIHDPNAKPGPDLNWEAFLGDSPKRPFDVSRFFQWRLYMDYSGGSATDNYTHFTTQMVMMLGVKFPYKVAATGGKFRYTEREVPDSFDILIHYPEKITMVVLGTQGNPYQGTGSYNGGRAPIIRGWEGTLLFQPGQIKCIGLGKGKKEVSIPLTEKRDQTNYWADFLECCRTRNKNTASPIELAYHSQTAIQMAILGWQKDKIARFDAAKEIIVL